MKGEMGSEREIGYGFLGDPIEPGQERRHGQLDPDLVDSGSEDQSECFIHFCTQRYRTKYILLTIVRPLAILVVPRPLATLATIDVCVRRSRSVLVDSLWTRGVDKADLDRRKERIRSKKGLLARDPVSRIQPLLHLDFPC